MHNKSLNTKFLSSNLTNNQLKILVIIDSLILIDDSNP